MRIMPIAIPDSLCREKIAVLQETAAAAGAGAVTKDAHITLATLDLPDAETLAAYLARIREALAGMRGFPVFYSGVSLRREWMTVTCDPDKNEAMLETWRRVAAVMPEYLDEHYRGEAVFTPHTTLIGRTAGDLTGPFERIRTAFTPFRGIIERIDISLQTGENSFEIVHSARLPRF